MNHGYQEAKIRLMEAALKSGLGLLRAGVKVSQEVISGSIRPPLLPSAWTARVNRGKPRGK